MTTTSYIKAGFIAIIISIAFIQTARVSDLQIENQELQGKISFQPVQEYHIFTSEDFLSHLDAVGNIDTAFSRTSITRDVNHWVPGKTKVDTVTTKYEVHISVTEDSK